MERKKNSVSPLGDTLCVPNSSCVFEASSTPSDTQRLPFLSDFRVPTFNVSIVPIFARHGSALRSLLILVETVFNSEY